MRQVEHVKADTPHEFVAAYNKACAELSKFTIVNEERLGKYERFIYYDKPEPEQKKEECKTDGLYCADCLAYEWGRKCRIHGGHRKPLDPACEDVKWAGYLTEEEEEYSFHMSDD